MSLHLADISQAVSPGAQAVVLLDQAGWHTSPKLNVPANISLLALPPKSPELNPTENVWQYLRDNLLSNRVFASARDIVDQPGTGRGPVASSPWPGSGDQRRRGNVHRPIGLRSSYPSVSANSSNSSRQCRSAAGSS
jgi:hypothetical protein